jgi:sulfur relay (sulfurtransferase) DsrC/TusE family protein
MGISLLYNLMLKLSYATEIYGSSSIIPRDVFDQLNGPGSFSIFSLVQSDIFASLYIWVCIALALLFTIGYKVKLVGPILLFLYWNLLQAYSAFCFGFDYFTFNLFFWAIFLPLANHFALGVNASKPVSSWLSLVILVQITWVYFATGLAKYGESWQAGYAIRNMLMDKWATTGLGDFMLDKPLIYKPLTYTTLIFELAAPIFVLAIWQQKYFRIIFSLFLIGFHLTIMLSYKVGNFSLTGLAVAALILPASVWDKIGKSAKSEQISSPVANTWVKALCIAAIVTISFKNVFFLSKHSGWRESTSAIALRENLGFLDKAWPVKISFLNQYWKMFAPNPPVKAGWFALEVEKTNGETVDLMTGNTIGEVSKVNWIPKGWELYFLYYARTFDRDEPQDKKFKIWIKYWILHQLKTQKSRLSTGDKLYLTDYIYLVTDQSEPHEPPVNVNMHNTWYLVNEKDNL